MKNKILDNYYKGNAINAYEFFGAHICEERGKRVFVLRHLRRMHRKYRSLEALMIGAVKDTRCVAVMIKEYGHYLLLVLKKEICINTVSHRQLAELSIKWIHMHFIQSCVRTQHPL